LEIASLSPSFFFAAAVEQQYNWDGTFSTFSRLPEEQFPPVETQHPLRRMAESSGRTLGQRKQATVRLLAWLL